MNATRLASMERNLNGIERKVLAATPISEWWSEYQMIAEIKRLGGNVHMPVFQGALGSLLAGGLVKRDSNARYQRVVAKDKPPAAPLQLVKETMNTTIHVPKAAPAAPKAAPAAPGPATPEDSLTNLANQLRQLAKTASDMADSVDEAALDFQAQLEKAQEQLQQFAQLKTLLSSLK